MFRAKVQTNRHTACIFPSDSPPPHTGHYSYPAFLQVSVVKLVTGTSVLLSCWKVIRIFCIFSGGWRFEGHPRFS